MTTLCITSLRIFRLRIIAPLTGFGTLLYYLVFHSLLNPTKAKKWEVHSGGNFMFCRSLQLFTTNLFSASASLQHNAIKQVIIRSPLRRRRLEVSSWVLCWWKCLLFAWPRSLSSEGSVLCHEEYQAQLSPSWEWQQNFPCQISRLDLRRQKQKVFVRFSIFLSAIMRSTLTVIFAPDYDLKSTSFLLSVTSHLIHNLQKVFDNNYV